mmetsp:Transcript_93950/g.265506  ORF Transcript_93950/g.265506 Transcript_93950/m.265506 type:complete len:276 (-) Transcript_93950:142-969(-)
MESCRPTHHQGDRQGQAPQTPGLRANDTPSSRRWPQRTQLADTVQAAYGASCCAARRGAARSGGRGRRPGHAASRRRTSSSQRRARRGARHPPGARPSGPRTATPTPPAWRGSAGFGAAGHAAASVHELPKTPARISNLREGHKRTASRCRCPTEVHEARIHLIEGLACGELAVCIGPPKRGCGVGAEAGGAAAAAACPIAAAAAAGSAAELAEGTELTCLRERHESLAPTRRAAPALVARVPLEKSRLAIIGANSLPARREAAVSGPPGASRPL